MIALAPPLLPARRRLQAGIVAILLLATLLVLAGTAGAIRLARASAAREPARLMVQVGGGSVAQDRVVSLLAAVPGISEARPLTVRELARLIEVDPADLSAARLPLPRLIEVTLATRAERATVERTLATIPGAEVVGAAADEGRGGSPLQMAMLGMAALAALLGALGAAGVARAERMARRQDLALLRDLGATRLQCADAIGRPLLRDMTIGVTAGAMIAVTAILWLVPGTGIGVGGWLIVLLVASLVMIGTGGGAYLALIAGPGRQG